MRKKSDFKHARNKKKNLYPEQQEVIRDFRAGPLAPPSLPHCIVELVACLVCLILHQYMFLIAFFHLLLIHIDLNRNTCAWFTWDAEQRPFPFAALVNLLILELN